MLSRQQTILILQTVLTTLSSACLIACGGSSSSNTETKLQLTGTAAFGAPMANALVTVTDAKGKIAKTTAASDGQYTINLTGFTAPFLIKATGSWGDSVKEYFALVTEAPKTTEKSTANVTPLTHALVTMLSSDGSSPHEFSDPAKLKALDTRKLTAALGNLQMALKDVLADANLPGTFDPLTSPFKADRTSAADVLLETIKVSVSDQGVALTNARVPVDSEVTTSTPATVTIKGTPTTAPATLPKPLVAAAELKGLDIFQAEANACLALSPAARVSKSANGTYTFLGACADVTGFASHYKAFGYTLNQLWGPRLLNQIPQGSTMNTPEFELFMEGGNKAIVRLSSQSDSGGRVFIETAAKGSDGKWHIEGNQRNYDAGIGVGLYRQTDVSTNGWTIPATFTNSADKGKNVGKFSAYSSRLGLVFNLQGPNAADVHAARVKGPGLPAEGVVLARSSSCGTHDYLAIYRNDGGLPSLDMALPTSSTSNQWILDAKSFGGGYTGSDFYNQYRGLSSTGSPSISVTNYVAPTPVDMKTIPAFAIYSWEIFKTTSMTTPADTFTTRIMTRPLAASEGSKQPWANLSAETLDYLNPASATNAIELDTGTVSWNLQNATAPAVTSAFMSGAGVIAEASDTVTMNMSQSVEKLGDTRLTLKAVTQANGLGQACSYRKLPAFTATIGSRSVGVRQITVDGLRLQSYSFHTGRAAN